MSPLALLWWSSLIFGAAALAWMAGTHPDLGLVSYVKAGNLPSVRVLEKLGAGGTAGSS